MQSYAKLCKVRRLYVMIVCFMQDDSFLMMVVFVYVAPGPLSIL